ncbi:MAG: L-threonylcarbamoyladenylate synthase [Candidatus Thorarchaeota archaeon]
MTIEIVRVEDDDSARDAISRAVEIIQAGGLVVYPTDTSYGLACDPLLPDALERLFDVKHRDRNLGIPLLFSDLTQCETYHEFGSLERVIVRLFWPGGLTLVVFPKESVPKHITAGRASLAIRVPKHPIPRGIAKTLGGSIAGTSANISGGQTPFDVSIAADQLGDTVDLYIDGGPSQSTLNSTIVGVEEDGCIKVYREGQVSIETLTENLKVDSDALRYWSTRIVFADM